MPKRKSGAVDGNAQTTPSLSSLDAALDLLVCDTFSRLESLTAKFEAAAGVKLNSGVVMHRWEEASKRYWVMKSMDDLSCSSASSTKARHPDGNGKQTENEMAMDDGDAAMSSSQHNGRIVLLKVHC